MSDAKPVNETPAKGTVSKAAASSAVPAGTAAPAKVTAATNLTDPFRMEFDISTIKHLGLQMYSTLPPVIGELVANAWDADAEVVGITIPTGPFNDQSEIVVADDGNGMTDEQVREGYLIVGRDRRRENKTDRSPKLNRRVMGRKGIGKLAGFGIAAKVEVETISGGKTTRFEMDYKDLEANADRREITFPPLPPTGEVKKGTRITLRQIGKWRTRSVDIASLRRALARRFAVIDPGNKFTVKVNGEALTAAERDLTRLLERDVNGKAYLWEYNDHEIKAGTGWKVSGWIGALDRTNKLEDGIQRGIVVMARGKLVQEPFVFDATVGQQFALSYIVGELHAEFVDEEEDTIGTTRNQLVWDSEANEAFKEWGEAEVNKVARLWAERRQADNEARLQQNEHYKRFKEEAKRLDNKRALKVADRLVRDVVNRNLVDGDEAHERVVQLCLEYVEFDAFWELAEDITGTGVADPELLEQFFREWEIVEAKEMMRVTRGRISTIEKLQELIETNALEVPTLHKFLKQFPWVLDPRWSLVADEKRWSDLLKEKFPEGANVIEEERRIDFLCVREGTQLVVVEIKRPQSKASTKELDQISRYVKFVRHVTKKTTDPDFRVKEVVGYLLVGSTVDTWEVTESMEGLAKDDIYVRRYSDLLHMVENSHEEFLERYNALRQRKAAAGVV